MSELGELYRHIRALPTDIVGTLACFCFNHQSTLDALSMLPLSGAAFLRAVHLSGTPKHILARWLMRNPAGAQIVAYAINDCRYPWELTDMVDVLCEPAGPAFAYNAQRQDAPPDQIPSGSLILPRIMNCHCPSLLLLRALCALTTFDVVEFGKNPVAQNVVVNTLRRWEQSAYKHTVVATACGFGAHVPYDPRKLCNLVAIHTNEKSAVGYLLHLFHACPTRTGEDYTLDSSARLRWRKMEPVFAVALALFAPLALDSMIPEGKRFVDEVRRLKIVSHEQLQQLLDEHQVWSAIRESERAAPYVEAQKKLAADTEQQNIQQAYADALARGAEVVSCTACAKRFAFSQDLLSSFSNILLCPACTPEVRLCRCCGNITRGAMCNNSTTPGQEVAIPMCHACAQDRASPSTGYRSPMAWPPLSDATCIVRCETCQGEIQLRVDQFCRNVSTLASISREMRNDVQVDPFGRVSHTTCLQTCEICSHALDAQRTIIINGIPYCRDSWIVCPGCREPVLYRVARDAPPSRKAPAERCYHRQTPSPERSDDDDEVLDDAEPLDDLDMLT